MQWPIMQQPIMQQQRKQLINRLRQQGIHDPQVLQAINDTPRHLFIDEALAHQAYDDTALPIGAKQTISQPYIVARMTELLQLIPGSQVLEIGTGSGYQTVVLSLLAAHVYSVERIKSLLWRAKRRFKQLDRHNISTHYGDGAQGWPTHAPFDAILVTAAAPQLPQGLCHQLVEGGRLVIPVGEQYQALLSITRHGDDFTLKQLESVRFVPLIQGELA